MSKSLKYGAEKWRNGLTCQDVFDIPAFLLWDPVTGPWNNLIFSSKFLFGWWCSISKSVNHISGHGFKCILESVFSTGRSVCYEILLRLYISLFYVCRWFFLELSTFEFGSSFLKQRSVPLWSANALFLIERFVLTSAIRVPSYIWKPIN